MVAGVAVVWSFLALTAGPGDEGMPIEEAADTSTTRRARDRATTEPRGSTTTTTEVIPGAPLLGEPSGLVLVVVNAAGRVVDLDTGGVTRLRARAVGVTDRGILVDDGGTLANWPAPYDGSGATTVFRAGPGIALDQLWVVEGGTSVWVVPRSRDPMAPRLAAEGVLVDLAGEVLVRFPLASELWAVGATDHGLVVDGPGGLYLVDAGGEVEQFASGDAGGLAGDRIYASNCDEDLRCFVEVFDGGGRRVGELPSLPTNVGWTATAPDGRLAYVEYGADDGLPNRVIVDGEMVYEDDGLLPWGGGLGGIAWSPDGRWLAIAALDGVHVLDTLGGTGEHLVDVGVLDQTASLLFVAPAP